MATRTITTRIALDGEKEFKNQMSQVNGELRNLKSEMTLANAEFKGQANSMEALIKKGDILKREYAQQEEKVKALEKAVADSAEAYGEADKRTDGYRQQLNNAKAQLINLNREINDNEKYLKEASDSADGAAKSIDGLGRELREAEDDASTFGDVLKASLASEAIVRGLDLIRNAASGLKETLKSTIVDSAAYADDILTMSTVTGIATDKLQEYRYMAELTDVSLDTITGSLTKLTNNMQTAAETGKGSAAEAFKKLGVSVTMLNGELRDDQLVFDEVIEALSNVKNETERDALAMDIFGKSAQDLNPLMSLGKDGIKAFREEARQMGYVLDDEALSSLSDVDDAMQRWDKTVESLKNKIGVALAPTISEAADALNDFLSGKTTFEEFLEALFGINDVTQEFQDLLPVVSGATAAFAAYKATVAISGIIDAVTKSTEGMTTAQALLNAVMNANPIVLVVSLLAALVAAFVTAYTTSEDFRNKVNGAFSSVKDHFIGIGTAIKTFFGETVPNAVNEAVDYITNIPQKMKEVGANLLQGLWDGISDKVEWLKGKVSGVVDKIKGWFTSKEGFDTHSPSKWSEGVAGNVMEGYAVGTSRRKEAAIRAAMDAIGDIKGAMSGTELAANINVGAARRPRGVTEETFYNGLLQQISRIESGNSGGGEQTINLSIDLDGTTLARKMYTYNKAESSRRGTSLVTV